MDSKYNQVVVMGNGYDAVEGSQGMDRITGATTTIDYEHHEIHGGSHFTLCGFDTIDEDETIDFVIQTPDTTKWAHMTFQASGTTQLEFNVYRTPTVTGGTGTAQTPLNNNENSSTASTLTILRDPTITNAGTELPLGSSSGLQAATPSRANSEGLIGRNRELILRQNTTYLFRFTSRGDGNIVSFCGSWYEHTNKNT